MTTEPIYPPAQQDQAPQPAYEPPAYDVFHFQPQVTRPFTSSPTALAQMLQAAGLYDPSYDPYRQQPIQPLPGPQTFTPGGSVDTGYNYQDPQTIAGDPKVQGSQRVYMGHAPEVQYASDPDAVKPSLTEKKVKSTTVSAASNLPYQWYGDKDKINKLEVALRKAGYTINSFDDAVKAWQSAVYTASQIYVTSKGHSLVTPWDVLENQASSYNNGPGNTHVQTTTRVNDLTEGQAWQILRGTMQSMLGRDPTQDEVNQFLAKANNDAANSPATTTTTTKTNAQTGRSHSTTSVDQGFTAADAQQAAYQELHNSADYGHYQAATTYFNALTSALGEVAGSQ